MGKSRNDEKNKEEEEEEGSAAVEEKERKRTSKRPRIRRRRRGRRRKVVLGARLSQNKISVIASYRNCGTVEQQHPKQNSQPKSPLLLNSDPHIHWY